LAKPTPLTFSLFVALWLFGCQWAYPAFGQPVTPIEMVCVDDDATGYATFQSHNQKVVANSYGIFMTHIRRRNADYTAQTWRLSRSEDGGRTFSVIYEATDATNPPVIETDTDGNIYLIRPDFVDGNAYPYRFLAKNDFRDPLITQIPNGSAGKYAMVLDTARRQIYYFAHNNTFHVVGLDGRVLSSVQLLKAGENAVLQYPLLNLDRDGTLHAAWTTQKHGEYLYWDIHHMLSGDAGRTWRNAGGGTIDPPVVADNTGPALRITLDDEFESHTWLSSFLVKNGKIHFMYLAQTEPARQHYMRYDVATGRREIDRQPVFQGTEIRLRGLDGFFAAHADSKDSPLYCLGRDEAGHVACLSSEDNGKTWQDYARSERSFNVYSLGGCRQVTDDGFIIGSFTDTQGTDQTAERKPKVYFFKIKAKTLAAGGP